MLADMHTHSEYSHDSVCSIEDMLLSQIKKGTEIFAVTDHFDTASNMDSDKFTPINSAYATFTELREKYEGKCLILFGIEIGEGFWYPEICKKVASLVDYDVVIGSVHLVKYKDLRMAYSKIDFSRLDKETILQYIDAYFDDVLTMIEEVDFDVLGHLTCPLRYISGKYNIEIDVTYFNKKIERILYKIIQKGIALEVNTSSFEALHDFMPTIDIIKKYYEMGGCLITLGSDAHISANASAYFPETIQVLKDIGFHDIYYYKQRKPYKIAIC